MVSKRAVTFFSRPERRVHLAAQRIVEDVQLIRMPQGGNDLLLRACISARVSGIVVEGSAGGNVTVPYYEGICDALAAGISVVVATRVVSGPTHFGKGYLGSLASLTAKGAIAAGYLSGLKARILLMVALGVTTDHNAIAEIFARAGGVPA
jgi:L-asparaginase